MSRGPRWGEVNPVTEGEQARDSSLAYLMSSPAPPRQPVHPDISVCPGGSTCLSASQALLPPPPMLQPVPKKSGCVTVRGTAEESENRVWASPHLRRGLLHSCMGPGDGRGQR